MKSNSTKFSQESNGIKKMPVSADYNPSAQVWLDNTTDIRDIANHLKRNIKFGKNPCMGWAVEHPQNNKHPLQKKKKKKSVGMAKVVARIASQSLISTSASGDKHTLKNFIW